MQSEAWEIRGYTRMRGLGDWPCPRNFELFVCKYIAQDGTQNLLVLKVFA